MTGRLQASRACAFRYLMTSRSIVRADDECFTLLPPAAHLAAAINHFFATSETDNAEDGSLYNSSRHMRAWFDQVRTLKAHP